MASLIQVLQTLTSLVENACYPHGNSQPSVTGNQITINSGFPIRTQQDQQIGLGNSMVYLYPTDKERVVTKFERIFRPIQKSNPTIFATIDDINQTVTLTGSVSIPQSLVIIVNKVGYGYQIQSDDTLNRIASSMADLIPGATANNNVINLTNAFSIIARVATNYTAGEELSRVERVFDIFVVSPNYIDRSIIIDAIDVYLKQQYRFVLPDQFIAMLFYNKTVFRDDLEQYQVFKGWLEYMVQYPTTLVNDFTTITTPVVDTAVNY